MLNLMILILACGGSSEKPKETTTTEGQEVAPEAAGSSAEVLEGTHCADGETVTLSCALPERVPEVLSVCSKGDAVHVRFGELGKPEVSTTGEVKHTSQAAGELMKTQSWSFTEGEHTWVVSDQTVEKEQRIELTRAGKDGSSVSWLCGDLPANAAEEGPEGDAPAGDAPAEGP